MTITAPVERSHEQIERDLRLARTREIEEVLPTLRDTLIHAVVRIQHWLRQTQEIQRLERELEVWEREHR